MITNTASSVSAVTSQHLATVLAGTSHHSNPFHSSTPSHISATPARRTSPLAANSPHPSSTSRQGSPSIHFRSRRFQFTSSTTRHHVANHSIPRRHHRPERCAPLLPRQSKTFPYTTRRHCNTQQTIPLLAVTSYHSSVTTRRHASAVQTISRRQPKSAQDNSRLGDISFHVTRTAKLDANSRHLRTFLGDNASHCVPILGNNPGHLIAQLDVRAKHVQSILMASSAPSSLSPVRSPP